MYDSPEYRLCITSVGDKAGDFYEALSRDRNHKFSVLSLLQDPLKELPQVNGISFFLLLD